MKARTLHESNTDYYLSLLEHLRGEIPSMAAPKGDASAPSPELPEDHAGHRQVLSFSGYEQDALFMNRGDGTFVELGSAAGVALPQDGRAVGAADLDHDGAIDLVVRNVYSRPLVVLRNQLGGRSVTVRLRGRVSNRFGIGARVNLGSQVQEMQCGSGYLYGNPPELHFGMTVDEEEIVVLWPSGKETRRRIQAGQILTIDENGQIEGIPYLPATPIAPSVTRMVRPGDSVSGWQPSSVKVVWNSRCATCSQKADFGEVEFVETDAKGLVHPSDSLFPVTYVIGRDGKVAWKWVGRPSPEQVHGALGLK